MSGEGFVGALRLVGFASGAAVAFIALPSAYDVTWPWLTQNVIGSYSPSFVAWVPFLWSCLLAVLIYAATRMVLFLIVSTGGLLLALLLIFRRWKD